MEPKQLDTRSTGCSNKNVACDGSDRCDRIRQSGDTFASSCSHSFSGIHDEDSGYLFIWFMVGQFVMQRFWTKEKRIHLRIQKLGFRTYSPSSFPIHTLICPELLSSSESEESPLLKKSTLKEKKTAVAYKLLGKCLTYLFLSKIVSFLARWSSDFCDLTLRFRFLERNRLKNCTNF